MPSHTLLRQSLIMRNYKLYLWIISESRDSPGHDGCELRNWPFRQSRLKPLPIVIFLVSPPCRIRQGADPFRGRVCNLERRCQAKIIPSYYVSRGTLLVHDGQLLTRSGVLEGEFGRFLKQLTLLASHHPSEELQPLAERVTMSPVDRLPHAQVYIPQIWRRHLNLSLQNLRTVDCGLSWQPDVVGLVKSPKMVG